MLNKKSLLLSMLLLMSAAVMAQVETPSPATPGQTPETRPGPDASQVPDRRMDQHERWLNHEESFPARPRSMWQVGLHGGIPFVTGDVRPDWGYGGGLFVRKSIGYIGSIRAQYTRGRAHGLNWLPTYGIASNPAVTGGYDPNVNYWDPVQQEGFVYHNYKMRFDEFSLSGIISLSNINFHTRRQFVNIYALGGVGVLIYDTWINQLDDAGQMYDYTQITQSGDRRDRREQRSQLKEMLDDTYESRGEFDRSNRIIGENERILRPSFNMGGGINFRLSRRVNVALEHRAIYAFDDLLDGHRWSEPMTFRGRNILTPSNDVLHYSSVHLGFNLGRNAEEPSWWVNPLEYVYDQLNYLDDRMSGLWTDTDGDGVPDFWDLEPDTPEGAVVDNRGRTLDSDGDGCPDHLDPEPFSSPQFPIVDCVNVFPFTTEDRVRELIAEHGVGVGFLPTIHFDTDRSRIKPEFYPDLQHIGRFLQENPTARLDVTGHADHRYTEEYNLALSQRRAESAVNFLVENYGIDRDRFNIRYEGETNPLVPNARTYTELYMNRRVEFRVARN